MTQQIVVPPLDTDDFLEHYGVPGMKWGKRKAGGSTDVDRQTAKADRVAFKNRRGNARKEIYKTAGNQLVGTRIRAGATIATGLFLHPAVTNMRVGYELTKAAGYSKGKSAAVGILAGTSGGVIAAEISANRTARNN